MKDKAVNRKLSAGGDGSWQDKRGARVDEEGGCLGLQAGGFQEDGRNPGGAIPGAV